MCIQSIQQRSYRNVDFHERGEYIFMLWFHCSLFFIAQQLTFLCILLFVTHVATVSGAKELLNNRQQRQYYMWSVLLAHVSAELILQ